MGEPEPTDVDIRPASVSLPDPHPVDKLASSVACLSMDDSARDAGQQQHAAEREPEAPQEAEEGVARPKTRGTVKWFSSSKGFGFIKLLDSEEEVFVHQSNIDTVGFRSLKEEEDVEFDLVEGEDGKKKAFRVTGPGGAPPLGSLPNRPAYGGGRYDAGELSYIAGPAGASSAPYLAAYGGMGPGRGRGNGGYSPWGPEAYSVAPPGYAAFAPAPHMGAVGPSQAAAAAAAAAAANAAAYGYSAPLYGHGREGFFPGGRNWAGARPPPPGQPGFSSGLQVVVHNLPWDCTWEQLKEAFSHLSGVERTDVVFDSRGRSRGFGIVRFSSSDMAERAVEEMNNQVIGGRVVSVRIDRFA